MATKSNPNAGRRSLTVSVVIGLLGTITTILLLNRLVAPPKSIWVIVGVFLPAGLIGLIAAAIALVRGRAIIRVMAIPGVLLSTWVTLFGLIGLWIAVLAAMGVFNAPLFG